MMEFTHYLFCSVCIHLSRQKKKSKFQAKFSHVTFISDACSVHHRYALHFWNTASSERVRYRVTGLSVEMVQ